MATGGYDRLSDLPDDLLLRVLHYAPLKEAASTTALSRRWRAPLWLSSGGVNLETGVPKYYYSSRPDDKARFFSYRESFDSAASAALDAANAPVTRLTLRLESDLHVSVCDYMTRYRENTDSLVVSRYTGLVDAVLSRRAARRVEELRLDATNRDDYLYGNRVGFYTVTLDSLPSETLRVLELSNCRGLLYQSQAPAVVLLPRLSSLRLSHSVQHLSSLQGVIDAAPVLAAIHLENVRIDATDEKATTRRLRCPVATVLMLDGCKWEEQKQAYDRAGYGYKTTVVVDAVEIDATMLRRFRYKGPLRNFLFSPQPLELEQVELDFFEQGYKRNNNDLNRDSETFWRFARSFTSIKDMRLRVNHLEDIAVLSEASRVELLPAFCRLERLEFQGVHWTKVKTAAVITILNLLRCCPVLSALRINLTTKHDDASTKEGMRTRTPQKEIQVASMLGPRPLQCLHSSLRRVGLQFQLEKSDCFGMKLINFFAENAMVLEEMRIDGGDGKLCKHMNPKTEKWNSRRRKLGATTFVVLPLNN